MSPRALRHLFYPAVIAERRDNPIDKNDLLNKMLLGKDQKTGKGLSEENIRNNVCSAPFILEHTSRSCADLHLSC